MGESIVRRRSVMTAVAAIAALTLAACGGAAAPTAAPTVAPAAVSTTAPTVAPASVAPVAEAPASVAPEASADPICIDAGDGGAPVCGRQAAADFSWRDELPTSTGREAAGGVKRVCIEADPSGGGTDPKLAFVPMIGDPVRIPVSVGRQVCVGGAGGQALGGTRVALVPAGMVWGAQCGSCWAFSVIDRTTIRAYWQDKDGTLRTTDITPGKKTAIEPGGHLTFSWVVAAPDGSLMLCLAGG